VAPESAASTKRRAERCPLVDQVDARKGETVLAFLATDSENGKRERTRRARVFGVAGTED